MDTEIGEPPGIEMDSVLDPTVTTMKSPDPPFLSVDTPLDFVSSWTEPSRVILGVL